MSAAIVYAEWWWTCDKCGSYSVESFDSRIDAERAADAHECQSIERIEHDARCPHPKCPGHGMCCCPEAKP